MGGLIGFIALSGALVWFYADSFPELFRRWGGGDYAYCLLVPFLAVLLAWRRRDRLDGKFVSPSPRSGHLALFTALALAALGQAAATDSLILLSLWLCCLAMLLYISGRRSLPAFGFPLLVLAFALPPPLFVHQALTDGLRTVSAGMSIGLLQAAGIPVFLEGNVLDLGQVHLQVVEACSGLRYLIPALILALLVGCWRNHRWWQRLLLLAGAVPAALAANALRIALVGHLAASASPRSAEFFFHNFSGWLVYALLLSGLLLLSLCLGMASGPSEQDARYGSGRRGGSLGLTTVEIVSPAPHLLIAAATVVAALFLRDFALGERIVPPRQTFDRFPMTLGAWEGARQRFEQEAGDGPEPDDTLSAVFEDRVGRRKVMVLISWFGVQSSLRAASGPFSCLAGGGWRLVRQEDLPPGGGRDFTVVQSLMERPGQSLLVNCWLEQRGRRLVGSFQQGYHLAVDAVTRSRSDGALVRLELPLAKGQSPEEGQAVLDGFIRTMMPELSAFVPL